MGDKSLLYTFPWCSTADLHHLKEHWSELQTLSNYCIRLYPRMLGSGFEFYQPISCFLKMRKVGLEMPLYLHPPPSAMTSCWQVCKAKFNRLLACLQPVHEQTRGRYFEGWVGKKTLQTSAKSPWKLVQWPQMVHGVFPFCCCRRLQTNQGSRLPQNSHMTDYMG